MPVIPQRPLHWREGMFLSPQHFQTLSRWMLMRIARGEEFGSPGAHGFASLQVDEEALKRDVFRIVEAEALFPDGTLASFPTIGRVSERPFAEHFKAATLCVYLGIPAVESNVPQVSGSNGRMARFEVETTEEFDENRVNAPQVLEFRRIQARLFFADEDRTGFECLKVAELARQGRAVVQSVLSPTHIPPLLACGASPVLMNLLKQVHELLHRNARDLAGRVPSMSRMAVSDRGAEVSGLIKLLSVNLALAPAAQLPHLQRLHPFDVYMWLVHVVGCLAIFGEERMVPPLPAYEHEDLGARFDEVFRVIQSLAGAEVAAPFDRLPFEDDPKGPGFIFRGEILPEWIEKRASFFLAVEMAQPADQVRDRVATAVKMVAPDEIDIIGQKVVPGIGLEFLRMPPIAFPTGANLHYFRIQTDGPQRDSWARALKQRSVYVLSTIRPVGQVKFHFFVEYPR